MTSTEKQKIQYSMLECCTLGRCWLRKPTAEQKAAALWNGAETCVCCGSAIPEGRQVCKKCEVMRHEQA